MAKIPMTDTARRYRGNTVMSIKPLALNCRSPVRAIPSTMTAASNRRGCAPNETVVNENGSLDSSTGIDRAGGGTEFSCFPVLS